MTPAVSTMYGTWNTLFSGSVLELPRIRFWYQALVGSGVKGAPDTESFVTKLDSISPGLELEGLFTGRKPMSTGFTKEKGSAFDDHAASTNGGGTAVVL